jgi:hypothetical protein
MRRGRNNDKAPAKDQSNNSRSEGSISGLVNDVASTGLMRVSFGSDDGLAKGDTLEVYRLAKDVKQSKYLGRVRVVEVSAKEAVAQPVGKMFGPPQPGDQVSSRITGD